MPPNQNPVPPTPTPDPTPTPAPPQPINPAPPAAPPQGAVVSQPPSAEQPVVAATPAYTPPATTSPVTSQPVATTSLPTIAPTKEKGTWWGIASIASCVVLFLFGYAFGAAVILGAIGLRQGIKTNSKKAKVISIIGILLNAAVFIFSQVLPPKA